MRGSWQILGIWHPSMRTSWHTKSRPVKPTDTVAVASRSSLYTIHTYCASSVCQLPVCSICHTPVACVHLPVSLPLLFAGQPVHLPVFMYCLFWILNRVGLPVLNSRLVELNASFDLWNVLWFVLPANPIKRLFPTSALWFCVWVFSDLWQNQLTQA